MFFNSCPQTQKPCSRPRALDGAWFKKAFGISFAFAFALFAGGKGAVYLLDGSFDAGYYGAALLRAKASFQSSLSLQKSAARRQGAAKRQGAAAASQLDIVFPSFPVSLTDEGKPYPALMEIHLKTDRLSAWQEIMSQKPRFLMHLLILLSGKDIGELRSESHAIRSRLNAFLFKGAITKARFTAALAN